MSQPSRLSPLDRHGVPELEETFSGFEKLSGFVPNAFLIMARRPPLVEARFAEGRAVTAHTTLDPQLLDLVATIVSLVNQSAYSLAHREASTARRGIGRDKFHSVADFETSEHFSDAERAALRFARDATIVPNAVTDDHFVDLRKYFSDTEIVDMLGHACNQAWMNHWNDTIATQLEHT